MLSIADYVEEDVVVDDGGQCGTLRKGLQTRCVSSTDRASWSFIGLTSSTSGTSQVAPWHDMS